MAFPTVAAVSNNAFTNDATPTLTLPTGIVSGSLVIVVVSTNVATTTTWPAGWNDIFDTADGSGASQLTIAYKFCDGTEVDVTPSLDSAGGSEDGHYRCFRIEGHHASTPPEVSAAAQSPSSSDTAPDSANLTPSWGSADTLWFTLYGWDNGLNNRTISVFPTNYTTNTFDQSGAQGCGLGGAYRELAAASEDPGAATLSAGESWVAVTLAVRPSAAAAATVYPKRFLLLGCGA
jgi:hypothetical protein